MRTNAKAVALSLLALGALAHAQSIVPGPISADLELVASGLTSPVTATHAGDGSGRLFVVDQAGFIRIIDAGGSLLPTPFLDLTSVLVTLNPNFDERGCLGIAFHPDYANNGRFFVRYSVPREGGPDEPCTPGSRGCHSEILAEFHVSADDPNVADFASLRELLRIEEPEFNHNSGHVAFGPDGMLYVTFGDGGGGNDDLDEPDLPHGPIGNGQNPATMLGSMLRLDVDSPPDAGKQYAVPADNPFVGVPGVLPEIYAYGFRNPYRFSFHPDTNMLIVADVGQALYEEITIVEPGTNHGWAIREGFACFDPFDPSTPPATCADTGPVLGDPLVDPVAAYDHSDGIAVVGGYVYRANPASPMFGQYVFGDFSRFFNPADGRLFLLDALDGSGTISELLPPTGALGKYLHGIGQDADGNLYALLTANLGPSGTTGEVYLIRPPCSAADRLTPFGTLDFFDVQDYLNAFAAMDSSADLIPDGNIDFFDVQMYLNLFASGCP